MKIAKKEVEDFVASVFYENFNSVFKENHIFYEHYDVSDNYLRRKAAHQKFIPAILQPISRFDRNVLNKRDVIALVIACLKDPSNVKKVLEWQEYKPHEYVELTLACGKVIGSGIVLGTDWNETHYFSNICVVLKSSIKGNNLFEIVTAYPVPDLDQSDRCWKARSRWARAHKNKRLTDIKRHSH